MTEPLVSLRAEARRLGVNPSTLSEAVHNGWRCAGEDIADRARFDLDTGHCVGFVVSNTGLASGWNGENVAEIREESVDVDTEGTSSRKAQASVESQVAAAVEELLDELVNEAVAFVAPDIVRREVEQQMTGPVRSKRRDISSVCQGIGKRMRATTGL